MPGRHRTARHTGTDSSLVAAALARPVRVVAVEGRRHLVHRLAAIGVVPGSEVIVLRRRGPMLVAAGGARIVMNRQTARAVRVEELP
jgi:Fe2+ transport system protein FeoA